MKLNFDQRGNLQPYEKITLTLDEFKDFFVGKFSQNSSRKHIVDNYLRFIDDFSTQVATKFVQWIDGSFVTAEEHPRDIDFVTFISHEIFEAKEKVIHDNFRLVEGRKVYGVDAYTVRQYPEDHAKYVLYQSD